MLLAETLFWYSDLNGKQENMNGWQTEIYVKYLIQRIFQVQERTVVDFYMYYRLKLVAIYSLYCIIDANLNGNSIYLG